MIKLVTIFVRKPKDYNELLSSQKAMVTQYHTHPEEFKIKTIVELSHEEFVDFKDNLLAGREFVFEHRDEIFWVKEKGTDNYSGLIVQASGSSYPRYVGIPMKKVDDFKLCPRCGELYCDPPAISRTDNKTEICSKCGKEEAVLAFCSNYKLIEFLDKLHDAANEFNAKITVKIPKQKVIVIEPDI